jgi:hypothetical protein
MEAELELAQAKLAEFKAQAKSAAADTQIKHAKQVDELEEKVGDTKAKLHELAEASDDVWEKFKDGVESSWKSLSAAIRNTAAKFKA